MRHLIVGTGIMAREHAAAFAAMTGVDLVATVEPDAARREEFAGRFGIKVSFATLQEAIDWGAFDTASNVTPDAVHHATTLPLLSAGKHVLCEKPLATSYADAAEMAAAAEAAGVIHMVNLSYRNVAALQRTREMVAAGAIGAVRHLDAAYLQSWLTQSVWGDWRTQSAWLWRLSTAHGSQGVLGDVGIHILDFAAFAAGMDLVAVSAQLHTFDKAPGGRIGEYVLDANDSFALSGQMENGALAAIHASRFASGHHNRLTLRIFGTEGGIEIANDGPLGVMRTCLKEDLAAERWTEVDQNPVPTNFERFAAAVAAGEQADPDFAHAAKLQGLIDAAMLSDKEARVVPVGAGM